MLAHAVSPRPCAVIFGGVKPCSRSDPARGSCPCAGDGRAKRGRPGTQDGLLEGEVCVYPKLTVWRRLAVVVWLVVPSFGGNLGTWNIYAREIEGVGIALTVNEARQLVRLVAIAHVCK